MTPTNRPRAGAGYRLLKVGEILEDGDEYDWPKQNHWGPITRGAIGAPLYAENVGRYRRQKKILPNPTKPINYQTLSLSMYKAKNIREARAIYEKKVGKK